MVLTLFSFSSFKVVWIFHGSRECLICFSPQWGNLIFVGRQCPSDILSLSWWTFVWFPSPDRTSSSTFPMIVSCRMDLPFVYLTYQVFVTCDFISFFIVEYGACSLTNRVLFYRFHGVYMVKGKALFALCCYQTNNGDLLGNSVCQTAWIGVEEQMVDASHRTPFNTGFHRPHP